MNLLDIVLYFSVALLGSAINSVAGGGTFLTFPVLILNGLTPSQANMVSTIALWPGSVASSVAYRNERHINRKELTYLLIISVLGSVAGALTFLYTPEITFKHMVPWLLLCAVLIFTFGRRAAQWMHHFAPASAGSRRYAAVIFQFLIAMYGGYFGAGIGILMLAMLQLMGHTHIHQMNALKTILGSAINAVAVALFVFSDRVVWDVAIVMIVGAIAGGYYGAKLSLRFPPEKVRIAVSVYGFIMTAYFFLYGV
jgi:hypothetical protein